MANSWHPESHFLDALHRHAATLGFAKVGFTHPDVSAHQGYLDAWLAAGFSGEMDWMATHATLRGDPTALLPGTRSVISVRLDYLPEDHQAQQVLADPSKGYISRYALGRDYHKVFRKRLKALADWISTTIAPHGYRVFTDSAPVLEKYLAEQAGLGWIGKHTLLLSKDAGSYFFLGEILTDLPLPMTSRDAVESARCGSCQACLTVCPTQAIIAPYQLDARRCISYLTIEYKGSIPLALRPLIGNRIFGCDDCQLVCPWNKYAGIGDPAFSPRQALIAPELITLLEWTEAEFLAQTEGSPLRRAGYWQFLRNVAVGLGNGPATAAIMARIAQRLPTGNQLVDEHLRWALDQLTARANAETSLDSAQAPRSNP
ncbi:MAG: tRNA epoxyqueuosine(34) reductase QueG [Litorivicinaceae bacterium]